MKQWFFVVVVVACAACIDWTRLGGIVKTINLKDSSVTIQNRDGDLLTVPVDYQVKIKEKHGELRTIQNLQLDENITLIRIQALPVKDETMEEMNKSKG